MVARDETEQGERALLNLGHTFGHALETAGKYSVLLHGEGVAIGMLLAAQLSERLGMSEAADTARLQRLLTVLGLPTAIPAGMDPEQLLGLMRLDKKNLAGYVAADPLARHRPRRDHRWRRRKSRSRGIGIS